MTSQFSAPRSLCSKGKSSLTKFAGVRFGIALAASALLAGNASAAKGNKVFYSAAALTGGTNIIQYDSANGLNTLLTTDVPGHADLAYFEADPKGMNVYFTADIFTNNVYDLHRIDIKSSNTTRISTPFAAGGRVEDDFKLDAKGASVFYRATPAGGKSELYRYVVKGGSTVKVNPPLADGRNVTSFGVHPKGTSALYIADIDTDEKFELYMSAAVEGAPAVKLDNELGDNADVSDFVINAKGTAAAYRADKDTDGMLELYYVDLKTRAVKKLNSPLVTGGNVIDYAFDPKGTGVVYIADKFTNDQNELFRVDVKTGNVVQLNLGLSENADVKNFKFDAKGAYLYYLADQLMNDVEELFQVNMKTLDIRGLNLPLVVNGDVKQFGLDGKGTAVFYVADQDINDKMELYRFDTKTGSIRKISDETLSNQSVIGADVDAKGAGIAYYSITGWLNSDLTYFDMKTGTRVPIDGMFDFVIFYKLLGGLQFMGPIFEL